MTGTSEAIDLSAPVRVAALQMHGRVADIPYNLRQAESLAREAFTRGARVVALPEFFTTPVAFDPRLAGCALPPANAAIDLLERLARQHHGFIGGSMLLRRGDDVFNTYVFMQPDGRCFTHDKDIPTMWENAFYVGGSDDGLMHTALGPVGAAVCWELIRTQTVTRLRDRIRFAITGSNWWGGPENWPLARTILGGVERANGRLAAEAPVTFARMPASRCCSGAGGALEGRFLLIPGRSTSVRYVVVPGRDEDRRSGGNVVARVERKPAGHALADVLLEPGKPSLDPDPASFWIPKLPRFHRAYWAHQNACGKWWYRNRCDSNNCSSR
jgi:predicted amidohydrolase